MIHYTDIEMTHVVKGSAISPDSSFNRNLSRLEFGGAGVDIDTSQF